MVSDQERARLLKAFDDSFHTHQLMSVWVHDETHEVNVKAQAISLKVKGRIPIKMGLVTGNFYCDECGLESLENAPHTVQGNFSCYGNLLTSLKGGPESVGSAMWGGGTYSCSKNLLTTFEGAPQHFSGYFVAVQQLGTGLTSVDHLPPNARLIELTHQKDLPMLKLLMHKQVMIRTALTGRYMQDITDVINKYAGEGKQAMLNCALELKQAGYVGNARW